MKKEVLTPSELARTMVGDGKKPNRYFVTIGFGYYRPKPTPEDIAECVAPEIQETKNSLPCVTMGPFTSRGAAEAVYQGISINTDISDVTGQTIGQVVLEDRLTGVVKDKTLAQRRSYGFYVDEW
jgi:hypothetical protein